MLPGLLVEALTHGCADCGKPFEDRHRVKAAYVTKSITSFYNQIELGIIGASVRNYWVHLDCEDPALWSNEWNMNPDIQHCVKCGEGLSSKDMVVPVFQIVDPRAVNPNDPTDVGVALGDRVYFVHADCRNRELNKRSTNLLLLK